MLSQTDGNIDTTRYHRACGQELIRKCTEDIRPRGVSPFPMPKQGTETWRIRDQNERRRMRGREKAVGESRQDGRAKAKEATKLSLERPSKRRQHSGICGRMPRLPVVRPSPVDKSWWAATCLLTTINHRPSPLHLGPIESWCNADPPTPRWHTPLLHSDPCRDQAYPALDAQLHPESQNLCVCVLGLAPKYQVLYRPSVLAAELPRTIRETAVCKPAACKQCAPNCGAGAVAGRDLQLLAREEVRRLL